MMQHSGRTLRKRFLTKGEKVAWDKLVEKRRQAARVKALRESNLRKAKAKKERELKKKRAKTLMESNLRNCEPEFRYIVQQWAKDKTTARVNMFFRLLEEVHCPMEPCYNPKKLDLAAKVLRKNKCGYKQLCYGLHLPDIVLGSEFWNKDHQREYDHAHELESILYELATI